MLIIITLHDNFQQLLLQLFSSWSKGINTITSLKSFVFPMEYALCFRLSKPSKPIGLLNRGVCNGNLTGQQITSPKQITNMPLKLPSLKSCTWVVIGETLQPFKPKRCHNIAVSRQCFVAFASINFPSGEILWCKSSITLNSK